MVRRKKSWLPKKKKEEGIKNERKEGQTEKEGRRREGKESERDRKAGRENIATWKELHSSKILLAFTTV